MKRKGMGRIWITLMVFLTLSNAFAQDTPVCPPPVPICRSYEISSCEYALNMIPVYVCRVDIGSILGIIGGGLGYGSRPQMVYQQQYNPTSMFSSYAQPQPQPIFSPPFSRTSQQYRPTNAFITTREAERDPPIVGPPQAGAGPQTGSFASRPQGQNVFQGGARDVSPNPVPQPPTNAQGAGYGQRAYQVSQQPLTPGSQPQSQQSSQNGYPGNAAMISDDQLNK
ncbi:hypothetical protein GE061_014307 [Apolygus lucorum]|uniref:VM domain-containing protein n=1 Tax=Apolygus lucorum TaxID=248454 RepID=A0A6A4JUZ8_APOLU|nr:hypothetical protein GE061_014307 [Apolygus lucorum]